MPQEISSPNETPEKRKRGIEVDDEPVPAATDVEAEMQRLLGFTGFSSTKGTHVEGNEVGGATSSGARRSKPRQYRQFMHRREGQEAPLKPET